MPRSTRTVSERYVFAAVFVAILTTSVFQAAAQPAVPEPPASAGPSSGQCVPACRDGYVCHEGQCISACNPPCGAGLVCTGAGQCVAAPAPAATSGSAAPPPPMPAVAPSAADTPPPAGAWKPQFSRRERAKYRFRPYVGLNLSLGGAGSSSYTTVYLSDSTLTSDSENYKLGIRPGIEGGFEFRLGRIFGVGPAFRLYSYSYRDTGLLDVLVTPTFHIPMGMVEILIPLNVGLTVANDAYDESATGFAFGVTPGINLWFVPSFGIYAQVGLNFHILVFDTYASVDYRPMLNTGVTFAF